MQPVHRLAVIVAAGASALSACQAPPSAAGGDGSASAWAPAVIEPGDAAMDALRSTLARAMERTVIALGAGDPTAQAQVSVLPLPPGPLEDRSLALPTTFDIVTDGVRCVLLRRDDGARFEIEGAPCRPLTP